MTITSVRLGAKRLLFVKLLRANIVKFDFSREVRSFVDDKLIKAYPDIAKQAGLIK
ncbi:hypothetical protein LCGC14_2664770 [marine sediment metagenome]|uniref:Uncharacterized protein n=1 Tax=marine sediment metagenome TaxID=412755 RepID=A0A0F8ZQV9_9ZZZZ